MKIGVQIIAHQSNAIIFLIFSFYDKKYKVFLRLFAHQREYQALMSQQ